MVAGSSNWTPHSTMHMAPLDSTMNGSPSNKLVLWVDAVGGFLVCPGDKIVLGQALPQAGCDVAIQADISRRHATIYREGEGYLLTPASSTQVNGRVIDGVCSLTHGSVIQLGPLVRLRFDRPHPLSATARLTMLSHHRTQPAVDGVILMSDAIVLGPKLNSHIVARDWATEVVMYRSDADLIVRGGETFEIDGQEMHGQASIEPGNRIAGTDFSLTLESV
jgi:hypothetical protein